MGGSGAYRHIGIGTLTILVVGGFLCVVCPLLVLFPNSVPAQAMPIKLTEKAKKQRGKEEEEEEEEEEGGG
jgi:hypothetical protein